VFGFFARPPHCRTSWKSRARLQRVAPPIPTLSRSSTADTLGAVSNTPTLREQREAHVRRARIIDQLRAQALATGRFQADRHGTVHTKIVRAVWRRKAFGFLLATGCLAWGVAKRMSSIGWKRPLFLHLLVRFREDCFCGSPKRQRLSLFSVAAEAQFGKSR
jgi:hypothetical protein